MISLLMLTLAAAPEGLPFAEALRLAEVSPRVTAARSALTQRQALAGELSRIDSNPFVVVQPGWRQSPTGQGAELYGTVGQNFNVSGYQPARRQALSEEARLEAAQTRVGVHDLRLTVARAWLAVWAAQASLTEAEHERDAVRDWSERLARMQGLGAVTRAEAAQSRAYFADAELEVLNREGEVFETGVQLARVLGLAVSTPSTVQSQLPVIDLPEGTVLQARLDDTRHAPRVEAAMTLRDVELAHAEETRANRGGWWLQGGLNVMREGLGDVVVQGVFQVTPPLFDRGERERAPFIAAAVHAEGEAQAAQAEARADRVRATHELEHSAPVLAEMTEQHVPAAEAAEQKRLDAGEITVFEWVLARRAVLSARGRRVRAQADHAFARFQAAELVAIAEGVAP